jgi:hypothetical protein
MLTSARGQIVGASNGALMQLETLEGLPCGCVVAIQTVRPSGVPVISLEAKGPHCPHATHRVNKVIRLGEPFDPLDYEDRGDVFA